MASEQEIQSLAQLLTQTLDPSRSKAAEQSLKAIEGTPGFPLYLLQIAGSSTFPTNTRLASALFFKNLIRRSWVDEEGRHQFAENDVLSIKRELIGFMISAPPSIQVQIGEAISIIADSDFYKRWDTLVSDLVSRLTPDNNTVNIGVLTVAHSIFKRWRPLYRSDELFTEILHVLERFGEPYLQLLIATDKLITDNSNNKEQLKGLLQTLNLLVKIYFDLSCQELPPVFEENLEHIMKLLHKYLTYTNPLLVSSDDDEAGPLEYVKAGICEVLVLYSQKYEDVFGAILPGFVESTWSLLTTTGLEPKYDILVSKALQFLTSVAKVKQHAEQFNNNQVLEQVIEKIIIPNMTLRTSDEELFEDDPIEFIRRDLEGSDSDTRRRSANDFLRQLMEQFEKNVTDVTSRYINHFMGEYQKAPSDNWRAKDTALYLFTSIAVKGVITQYGVNSVNVLVDIVEFFSNHIAGDLMKSFDEIRPILKVDAVKYMYTFRSQFTKPQLKQYLPLLTKHLASPDYVTYTYTAITTERILFLQSDGRPMFTKDEISPASSELLTQLFRLIEKGTTPEKVAENEFLMRCVMRLLVVCREDSAKDADLILKHLVAITAEISKNPSNPRFNHYHFEAIGAFIRFVAPLQPESIENALYQPLISILQNDVTEFIPYVFQLFGLLLESNPKAPLPENYKALIAPILAPTLWESRGNVPALVRLLTAMSMRGASDIIANNQLQGVLGIFQKLMSSKLTENSGFELLEAIITYYPIESLQPYMKDIFVILFTRLGGSKTELLVVRFVRFFYFLASRGAQGAGPDYSIEAIDSVQAGVFGQLYQSIILANTQKLQKSLERKTAVVGLTNLCTSSQSLRSGQYEKFWRPSVEALLKLLEIPPSVSTGEGYDQTTEADLDDVSFSVSFVSLNTAKKAPVDMFPEITDTRKWVGTQVKTALGGPDAATFQKHLNDLSAEAKGVLESYA